MALTGREMRPCWPRKVAVCNLEECNKARSATDVSSEVIMELINQGEKYIGKLEVLKKFHEEIDKINITNEISIQDLLRQVKEMLSYWREINQKFDKDKGFLLKLSLGKKNLGGGKKDE